MILVDFLFVFFIGRDFKGKFPLVMLALICLSSGKVIWELHFLIVHARVFKNTKVYNVEHVSNQGENLNDETVAFLNELEVTVPAL